MNRRKLLTFIATVPLAPIAAQAVAYKPIDDGWQMMGNALVCENHRDKAWPEECNCGPGMRYNDTLRS